MYANGINVNYFSAHLYDPTALVCSYVGGDSPCLHFQEVAYAHPHASHYYHTDWVEEHVDYRNSSCLGDKRHSGLHHNYCVDSGFDSGVDSDADSGVDSGVDFGVDSGDCTLAFLLVRYYCYLHYEDEVVVRYCSKVDAIEVVEEHLVAC